MSSLFLNYIVSIFKVKLFYNFVNSRVYMPTPMFIGALFTIARTWKQPRRSSTDERIKQLWYIYTMEYY